MFVIFCWWKRTMYLKFNLSNKLYLLSYNVVLKFNLLTKFVFSCRRKRCGEPVRELAATDGHRRDDADAGPVWAADVGGDGDLWAAAGLHAGPAQRQPPPDGCTAQIKTRWRTTFLYFLIYFTYRVDIYWILKDEKKCVYFMQWQILNAVHCPKRLYRFCEI